MFRKLSPLLYIVVTMTLLVTISSVARTDNSSNVVEPKSYGSGLYYFSLGSTQSFGESLAAFLNKNHATIRTMTPQDNGDFGATVGYWVTLCPLEGTPESKVAYFPFENPDSYTKAVATFEKHNPGFEKVEIKEYRLTDKGSRYAKMVGYFIVFTKHFPAP